MLFISNFDGRLSCTEHDPCGPNPLEPGEIREAASSSSRKSDPILPPSATKAAAESSKEKTPPLGDKKSKLTKVLLHSPLTSTQESVFVALGENAKPTGNVLVGYPDKMSLSPGKILLTSAGQKSITSRKLILASPAQKPLLLASLGKSSLSTGKLLVASSLPAGKVLIAPVGKTLLAPVGKTSSVSRVLLSPAGKHAGKVVLTSAGKMPGKMFLTAAVKRQAVSGKLVLANDKVQAGKSDHVKESKAKEQANGAPQPPRTPAFNTSVDKCNTPLQKKLTPATSKQEPKEPCQKASTDFIKGRRKRGHHKHDLDRKEQSKTCSRRSSSHISQGEPSTLKGALSTAKRELKSKSSKRLKKPVNCTQTSSTTSKDQTRVAKKRPQSASSGKTFILVSDDSLEDEPLLCIEETSLSDHQAEDVSDDQELASECQARSLF